MNNMPISAAPSPENLDLSDLYTHYARTIHINKS